MRTALSLVVVLGIVGSLAACSTGPDAAADCTPAKSGKASSSVTVTGDFGKKPTVKIDDPLTAKKTERTVVSAGDGTVARAGYDITAEFSVFNGTTGEAIDATDYDKKPVAWTLDDKLIVGFTKTLECSTAGSRVVGVIAPEDGIAPANLESLGLTDKDSLVIVADLLTAKKPVKAEAPLPKADGADQPLPDGFPDIKVSIADDKIGTPTLTLPGGDAPTELKLAVLKKGDGAEVGKGVDVVYDTIGGDALTRSPLTLADGGRVVSIVDIAQPQNLIEAWGKNAAYHFVFTRQNTGKLDALTTLVERGLVKPVIGATLPLARVGEAHEILENRRSYALRGKVAIDVAGDTVALPARIS